MVGLPRASHFHEKQRFKLDYAPISISQHMSERTGMHVVIVDRKGPKVRGYFALATEIFDNSGAPHTLEHLVFMGSRSYKYKGLLDKLAQRAYSDTNAWTAVDHTAYSLDTAGWEGFAQILPVYLEHVILPTLTDEGCYTEVHHIDGDGNDAGVVYSEMQAIQNTGPEILDIKARTMLYPENVGFRYETGGFMERLRILDPQRIRAFHKEMYQPKNLCLILTGEVDEAELFKVLDDFESSILSDIPEPTAPFKRPWLSSAQPPPLKETLVETVYFPEEDESTGEATIGLFGPDCNDALMTAAVNVVLSFLCGSSISALENTIVEKEQLASSITFSTETRPNSVIWFQPLGVATDQLARVERRVFEVLDEVVANPLHMKYLLACVQREKRQLMSDAETAFDFSNEIIYDFLFGERDGSTLRDLGSLKQYDVLESWSEHDWRSFIQKWLIDAHHISVLGKPSKALAKKLRVDEEARIVEQKRILGREGLKQKAEALARAVSINNTPIPESLLQKWPVPGVDSIHLVTSTMARSGLAKKLGAPNNEVQAFIDGKGDLPLFIQFEDVPSNFVHISLLLGTSEIATEHLPLLPLFLDNFFTTPITRDGAAIDFEECVRELEEDTVNYGISGDSRIGTPEGITITFQVEPQKYASAISWIRTMMFGSVFDPTRLKASLGKLIADIPETKRSGHHMLSAIDTMVHLDQRSSVRAQNTLVRAIYLKRLRKILNEEPRTVISWLESLRKSIFTFSNMRTLVVADVKKLPSPVQAWEPLVQKLTPSSSILPLIKQRDRLNHNGSHLGEYGVVIVPMSTVDSSYCCSSVKGLAGFDDPRLPAVLVALSFLEAVEGPLWTAVRGTGLAYGANFRSDIEGGFLQFSVYRSPDAYRAFTASRAIIESYVNGTLDFAISALEGAISGIVVGLADEQATMGSAGQMSFLNTVVRGLPADFSAAMLSKVRKVGVDEIRAVMKEYLLPAFVPGKADIVVTCAPVLQETIAKGFTDAGFKTQVQTLASFHDDYGLHGGGEDDADDDDDDDDDDEDEDDDDGDSEDEESAGSRSDDER